MVEPPDVQLLSRLPPVHQHSCCERSDEGHTLCEYSIQVRDRHARVLVQRSTAHGACMARYQYRMQNFTNNNNIAAVTRMHNKNCLAKPRKPLMCGLRLRLKIKMLSHHHIDKVRERIRKSTATSKRVLFYLANAIVMMATKSSILLRTTAYLSLLLAVFAGHTPRSSPTSDPDVVQYLTKVFDGVKGSGRKPVNEELNLLPDESEGFANMVRCFSADHIGKQQQKLQ